MCSLRSARRRLEPSQLGTSTAHRIAGSESAFASERVAPIGAVRSRANRSLRFRDDEQRREIAISAVASGGFALLGVGVSSAMAARANGESPASASLGWVASAALLSTYGLASLTLLAGCLI
jgi:hypothetical protein